jgi:hypothetical protein
MDPFPYASVDGCDAENIGVQTAKDERGFGLDEGLVTSLSDPVYQFRPTMSITTTFIEDQPEVKASCSWNLGTSPQEK